MNSEIKFEIGKVYEAVGGGMFVKVLARKSARSLYVALLDANGDMVPDGQLVAATVEDGGEESATFKARRYDILTHVSVYASDEVSLEAIQENARKRRERKDAEMVSKATALRNKLLAAGVSVKAAYDVYTILNAVDDAVVMKLFSLERSGVNWEEK